MRFIVVLFLFVTSWLLTGCFSTEVYSGRHTDDIRLISQVRIGETMEQIEIKAGYPSFISNINGESWYYSSEIRERVAIRGNVIAKRNLYQIKFDERGKVVAVNHLTLADAWDVRYDDSYWSYPRNESAIVTQILGNFGQVGR